MTITTEAFYTITVFIALVFSFLALAHIQLCPTLQKNDTTSGEKEEENSQTNYIYLLGLLSQMVEQNIFSFFCKGIFSFFEKVIDYLNKHHLLSQNLNKLLRNLLGENMKEKIKNMIIPLCNINVLTSGIMLGISCWINARDKENIWEWISIFPYVYLFVLSIDFDALVKVRRDPGALVYLFINGFIALIFFGFAFGGKDNLAYIALSFSFMQTALVYLCPYPILKEQKKDLTPLLAEKSTLLEKMLDSVNKNNEFINKLTTLSSTLSEAVQKTASAAIVETTSIANLNEKIKLLIDNAENFKTFLADLGALAGSLKQLNEANFKTGYEKLCVTQDLLPDCTTPSSYKSYKSFIKSTIEMIEKESDHIAEMEKCLQDLQSLPDNDNTTWDSAINAINDLLTQDKIKPFRVLMGYCARIDSWGQREKDLTVIQDEIKLCSVRSNQVFLEKVKNLKEEWQLVLSLSFMTIASTLAYFRVWQQDSSGQNLLKLYIYPVLCAQFIGNYVGKDTPESSDKDDPNTRDQENAEACDAILAPSI